MANFARFAGIIGLIFLFFGALTSIGSIQSGHYFGMAQITLGLLGVGLFLFYFAGDTLRSLSEKRETIYGVLGGIFLLLLLVGANIIANSKWGERKFDLTTNKLHSLSDESVKLVKSLKSKIQIISFTEPASREFSLIQNLVEKYTYVSPNNISLQMVEADKEPGLVKEYDAHPGEVIVKNIDTRKQLKLTAFTEEGLTIAIKKVMSAEAKTVYILQGHGEGALDSEKAEDLLGAKFFLENEGFVVKPLNLAQVDSVPKDASIVTLWGAQRPLSKVEVDKMQDYLMRGGNLIIGQDPLIAPTKDKVIPSGLEPLLEMAGLRFQPSIMLEYQVALLKGKIINYELNIGSFGDHPITESFNKDGMVQVSFAQPVEQISDFKNDRVTRLELAKSSENSWAEGDLKSIFASRNPNPNGDKKGPLSMAQFVEFNVADTIKDPLSKKGKLIVFGDSDFATNRLIQTGFNRDLFLNSFNFSAGEEVSLSIRPKTWTSSTLQLSDEQKKNINLAGVFLIPQLILILAGYVWVSRRSLT